MTKRADILAQEHELGENVVDYYNYIVDSMINGQRQQVKELFNDMCKEDQSNFINNFLEEDNSHQTSCKKICINELINL